MGKCFGFYSILVIVSYISISHALQCYVCTEQEGNIEKCLVTIATCEQGQDTCLTEIQWGSTPYWNTGAKKQFYISKRCAVKEECERIRKNNMPDCTHIWYQDWKCTECCQGDRCNYFVISGAKGIKVDNKIVALTFVISLLGSLHFFPYVT